MSLSFDCFVCRVGCDRGEKSSALSVLWREPRSDSIVLVFWKKSRNTDGTAGRQLATIPDVISAVLYICVSCMLSLRSVKMIPYVHRNSGNQSNVLSRMDSFETLATRRMMLDTQPLVSIA